MSMQIPFLKTKLYDRRLGSTFIMLVYFFSVFQGAVLPVSASEEGIPRAITQTLSFRNGASGYAGTVDAFLRGTTEGNTNFGANTNLEWDDNSGTTTDEITLIRFTNLFTSESGPIPNGATILSASLTYMSTNASSAPGNPANVYESLVDWAGSIVTYNNFGGEAGVQANEYNPSPIASAPADALSTAYTIDVTASLQRWSDGAVNYGWIFLSTGTDGVNVYSSEHATVSNRPLLNVTYTTDPVNRPPAAPVLIQPSNGGTDVSTSPLLEVTVTDPDANPLDVTFYGRPAEALPPGPDFTIIAMPDTQHYTDGVGDPAIFAAQTQWIADHKDELNIVFVTGLGDIVQNGNANDLEWQLAHHAYGLIEDPLTTLLEDGIPYGLAVGNHDQSPIGGGSGASTSKYNQYFGEARFAGRAYYGGHYGTDNDNSYQLFSASGMDFIIIHFEYDTTPEAAVLNWADNLLTTYSNRRAIVTTHHMINLGNPASWGVQGQAIYNALSDRPNLFLMLGGHVHGEGMRQDTAVNGNVVRSILSDYQGITNGGNGWLRIMTFSPANDTITVTTYSPTLDQFGTSPVMGQNTTSAAFSLPYDMQNLPPFEELGTVSGVTSGNIASFQWNELSPNTGYEWYAAVSDGEYVTPGTTWSFTTGTSSTNNTPTPTATATLTFTPTLTPTATNTGVSTSTFTATATRTPTHTPVHTATFTATPSRTPTATFTATASNSFPGTGILDTFNRTNGAIGSNWSGFTSGYGIASNQLDVTTSGWNTSILWNGTSFGSHQEAYITLPQLDSASGNEHGLILKSQSSTTTNNGLLYVMYDHTSRAAQVWTYHPTQNWLQHGANIPITFVNGDQFGARARADGSVEVYRNGSLLATRSITSWPFYGNGGYVGVWFVNAGAALADNFGGGNVSSGPTATATRTPTPTNTPTRTPTSTITVTRTPTNTSTSAPPTSTFTATSTSTNTATFTATFTPTATSVVTATHTATNTVVIPTSTGTNTPTSTPTQTRTNTPTPTRTNTPTPTFTATPPGGFPAVPVLDTFNRANGAIGSNWSGFGAAYSISASQLDVTSGGWNTSILWNAASFGANQEAYVTLTQLDAGSGNEHGLILKSQSSRSTSSGLLYVMYDHTARVVQVWTYHPSQGWVQRGANIAVTFANGDQFGARARADGTVEIYRNATLLATRSITAWPFYANSGYAGLWLVNAGGALMDNFGGGTTP